MSVATRSRPSWWCSILLLISLVLSLVQPAVAAVPKDSNEAIALLRQYNIIRGDNNGDLQLNSAITRAEMAVILVRINGWESETEGMKGLGLFSDTKGHWAEGYIATARVHGLFKGFEDGSFRPDESVTYAQAFTLVVRLVGREPDANTWPSSALMETIAINAVSPKFAGVAMLNAPAARGEIFTSVALALTGVKTAGGQTYFQKLIDSTPPEITVATPVPTAAATYQVQGSAKGAAQVLVNGQAAALVGENFSTTVSLQVGQNKITVEAVDVAGNRTVRDVLVTRTSAITNIVVSGPGKVAIGGTAAYTVQAFDAEQHQVPAQGVTVNVVGGIGTWDANTNTFRAAQVGGTGKLEFAIGAANSSVDVQVLGVSANAHSLSVISANAAYTQDMTVKVEVRDNAGNLVTDDYGRSITLTASGLTGVTVTSPTAQTVGGVAEFKLRGNKIGEVALTATSQNLPAVTGTAKFTTTTRVALVLDPARIAIGGGMAKVRAELRDEKGNVIANTSGQDIYVDLSLEGTGTLLQSRVRIAVNATNSAQSLSDGLYSPGATAGTGVITGQITSGQDYSVEKVSVQTYAPTAGSGTKFQVAALDSRVDVGSGKWAAFMVQVVDNNGNAVTAADYAFQLEVSTSNNEPKTNGVPAGVTVRIGDINGLNPVSDGKAEGSDVIARTRYGSAVIQVMYDKPGVVTVKPVAAGRTDAAYSTEGEVGEAQASSSGWITDDAKSQASFRVTPDTVRLTVDSDIYGHDAPGASIRSGGTRALTAHAYLAYTDPSSTDLNPARYWVPGTTPKTLDLYKNGTKIASATTSDGVATFTITAPGTAGNEDEYVVKDPATSGKLQDSNALPVRTDGSVPAPPGMPTLRGVPSNTTEQVLVDDTHLELDLPTDSSQRYVIVKVYTEGSSSLIYTSGPVDVSGGVPTIRVPKSALPTSGSKSYYVRYRNGFGESANGTYSYPVTNYTYTTGVSLSGWKYDAVNNVIYLSGSGFAKDDTINASKIRITDSAVNTADAADRTAYLSGATGVYMNSSTTYKLDLSGVPGSELAKLATFAGASTKLSAEPGWYVKAAGTMANEDLNNPVTTLAHINYAAYDKSNSRLIIYGRGFLSGSASNFKKDLIKVGNIALNAAGMSVNTITRDTEIWVTLNAAAKAAIESNPSVGLTAADGWFSDGVATAPAKMAAEDATIYGYVRATSVTWDNTGKITVWGEGFANAQIGSGQVRIVDEYRPGNHEIILTGGAVALDGRSVTYQVPSVDLTEFKSNFRTKVYLVTDTGWVQVLVGTTTYREAAGIPSLTLKFSK